MGEPVDQEDGRLEPQSGHLFGTWMPSSLIDQREGSNVELKTKGRIERELQWDRKVKGSSALQNFSKEMSRLQKGCVHLFYSQVGRDKLSLQELNKGTLVYSQADRQGSPAKPLSMILIIKGSQRNSVQHGVRIGFLPETMWLLENLIYVTHIIFLFHNTEVKYEQIPKVLETTILCFQSYDLWFMLRSIKIGK